MGKDEDGGGDLSVKEPIVRRSVCNINSILSYDKNLCGNNW